MKFSKTLSATLLAITATWPIMAQDSLPIPRWEEGHAIVTGKILNYDSATGQKEAEVYPRCAFGQYLDKKHGKAEVDSAGNFLVNVVLYQTHQPCFVDVPGYYGVMHLSPGDSVHIAVDLSAREPNGYHGADNSVVFSGSADCDLNNGLATNAGHDVGWNNFNNIGGFRKKYADNAAFTDAVMAHRASQHACVDTLPLTDRTKDLLRLNIDVSAAESMLMAPYYRIVIPDTAYYSFIASLDMGNPIYRWASDYDAIIRYCSNLYVAEDDGPQMAQTSADIYQRLLDSGKLNEDETEFVEGALRFNLDRMPPQMLSDSRQHLLGRATWLCDSLELDGPDKENAQKLLAMLADGNIKDARKIYNSYLKFASTMADKYGVSNTYRAEIFNDDFHRQANAFFEANKDANKALHDKYSTELELYGALREMEHNLKLFADITGIDSDELRQNMVIGAFSQMLEKDDVIPDMVFDGVIRDFSPVAISYLNRQNEVLKRVLAGAVSNVSQMSPDDDCDRMLIALAEKHPGKMIFIDIWNTWCGACLNAINAHEPQKPDYADKVAFVYLADESSPEDIWNKRIQSITGDHYRLGRKQHESLMQKFNFSGYPSYIVIDSDGEIVHTGYIHSLSELNQWL